LVLNRFARSYGGRNLNRIKLFENICCWVELRSPNRKLKMIVKAIAKVKN